MKQSWIEKRNTDKPIQVKVLNKRFADIPEGDRMLISTPKEIDRYIRNIPIGKSVELRTMRRDLAISNQADNSCPVTSGIFLKVVAEAAYQEWTEGKSIEEITPFWRVIHPKMAIVKKLSFDPGFIANQRAKEHIDDY